MYDFQQFETSSSFVDSIYTGKISMDDAEMDQTNLLENMVKFNKIPDQDQKKIRVLNENQLLMLLKVEYFQ